MSNNNEKIIIDEEVERKYKFGRTLGQGTFATVKMVTSLADGSKWAVKIIKRSALSSEDEESLKTEIQILQLTKHSNIVSVKEVFYCKHYVYLVMDLMTGGELFDRIVTKDHYSEQETKMALAQIVTAIKYCHDRNIVHRDLKPENILYQGPEDSSALKLADFGLAALLKPNQLMTVACGTPGYVAPEVLRGIAYGKEVDIWSIGVILYILLCGFPPFYDDNNKKLFAQIVNANYSFPDPYWTNISSSAKDLVTKLLVIDPRQRLSAQQILDHPWMREDGSAKPLDHFKSNLKSYNARRRLRSAIRAVQITQLLKNLAKQPSGAPMSIMAAIDSADQSVGSSSDKQPSQVSVTPQAPQTPLTIVEAGGRTEGETSEEDADSDGELPTIANTAKLVQIPESAADHTASADSHTATQDVAHVKAPSAAATNPSGRRASKSSSPTHHTPKSATTPHSRKSK